MEALDEWWWSLQQQDECWQNTLLRWNLYPLLSLADVAALVTAIEAGHGASVAASAAAVVAAIGLKRYWRRVILNPQYF